MPKSTPVAGRGQPGSGGVKKGFRHTDEMTRAAVVAFYEAEMSYKDIREKYVVQRKSVYRRVKRKRDDSIPERRSNVDESDRSTVAQTALRGVTN